MSANAVSKFRAINDFPELVEYLGDELDWPIQTDDFEEMTFEEIGLILDTTEAAARALYAKTMDQIDE